jgi:hypothetical protein
VGLTKGEIVITSLDEVVAGRKQLKPGLFAVARALAE